MQNPRVLSIVSLKGGVGKSTLAASLAAEIHASGRRVLLVDADPQGTLSTWAALAAERERDGPPVVAVQAQALMQRVRDVGTKYELVLIDTPSRLGKEARLAMMAATLVVMPISPGGADVWALEQTLDVFEEARTFREGLPGAVLVNRADSGTLTKGCLSAVEELGVPILPSVRQRVAFGHAMLAGEGVTTFAPVSDAAFDVRRLVRLIAPFEGDPS